MLWLLLLRLVLWQGILGVRTWRDGLDSLVVEVRRGCGCTAWWWVGDGWLRMWVVLRMGCRRLRFMHRWMVGVSGIRVGCCLRRVVCRCTEFLWLVYLGLYRILCLWVAVGILALLAGNRCMFSILGRSA